jgi:hypothetical protein
MSPQLIFFPWLNNEPIKNSFETLVKKRLSFLAFLKPTFSNCNRTTTISYILTADMIYLLVLTTGEISLELPNPNYGREKRLQSTLEFPGLLKMGRSDQVSLP